ncbi:MAG: hypothetical protein NVSMB16_08350 [Acidimicrobiales bacterium]
MKEDLRSAGPWSSIRRAQWVTIVALIALSELMSWRGQGTISYGVDAVAVVAYLGFRYLRRRESAAPMAVPTPAAHQPDGDR